MQNRQNRAVRCSLSIIIAMLGMATTYAQQQPTPPPIIGYGFDEFHIGGETVYHPGICSRQLNMDFTYHYGGYSSWWQLNDPSRWGNNPRRAYDFRDMVLHADTVGMKLIYSPDEIFLTWPSHSFLSIENYFGSEFHKISVRDFRDTLVWTDPVIDSVFWIPKRYVAAVAVKGGVAAGDSLLIAGAQRFSNGPLQFAGGDGGRYWRDVLGLPADSSFLHDVTATIRADDIPFLMDTSTVLAYVKLYRRVTEGQDSACPTCHCNWFVQWGPTLNITKGMYVQSKDTAYGFKDLTFTIDFRQTIKGVEQFVGKSVMPANYDAATNAYCGRLFDTLQGLGLIPDSTFDRQPVEGSDFYYAIYTTRRVPISFMRMRLAQHLFDYLLRPVRYDSSYRLSKYFLTPLDTLMRDPKLWPMMAYITSIDEPHDETFGSYRIFASMIQRHMMESVHPNNTSQWRGLSANPIGGYGTLRILSGDFDTLAYKPASLIITHSYPITAQPPAFYADKGKMDTTTWTEFYSGCYRSTLTDYLRYTKTMNDTTHSFGNPVWNNFMIKKSTNCDAVDDAQFKYEDLGRPKIPVYNNIQVAGYMKIQKDAEYSGFIHEWGLGGQRPSTFEEITGQTWLSMNCGNQGVMFSDLLVTGDHMGLFTRYGTWGVPDDSIYARLEDYGDYVTGDSVHVGPTWTIPKMWLGNKQRFDAIKKVTAALKRIDTLYTKLEYQQKQISVERSQDPPGPFIKIMTFREMPLVDSAYTIMAQRLKHPDSLGRYKDSLNGSTPVADSIHRTYLEITHFGFKDPKRNATGERVLMITNRRLWPIDWDHDSTNPYWDGNYGLGAIDVRLPVLRLKNTTGVVADSFIIERVGEPYAWRDTGAFGHDLQLQWLEPGWGAMYRVTPLSSGVSDYGTSFSNAVRSLNTSTPASGGTRYLTYERDSVIYLRALSSEGMWGKEFMISDAADLDSTSNKRNGYNLFPAIAKPYKGHSLMIVWEHHDSVSGNATVQACYLDTLLRASDTLLPDTTRMPLSPPKTLTANWMRLAPSIVGIDSGYVVSWSRLPLKGIEVVAVRDTANPAQALNVSLPLKVVAEQVDVGFAPDTNAWHSTLAYVPTHTTQVAISTSEGAGPYSTLAVWNVAHLSYQQGIPEVDPTSFIFYNKVGVIFPAGQRPVVTAWRTEHVTKDLPGCRFLHPSIAADSARIGVAFEKHHQGYRLATLRFRDSLNGVATRWGLQWKTPTYSWGWDYLADWKRMSVIQQHYERPSLTHFPAIDRNDLLPDSGGQLQGGLTWMWTNPPTSASGKSLLKLYRYGWTKPEEPGPGQYPTMTLSPYVEEAPWENSSLFYRHDTTRRFLRAGRRYYPAFVLNTPTEKSRMFQNSATRNRIYSYGILMRNPDLIGSNECGIKIGGGFHHDFTPTPPTPPNNPQAPKKPGLPPTFFGVEAKLDTTVEHSASVTRSGVFTADTGSVTIGRTIVGSSDGVSWLNSFAFDTARNSPADVWMITELVRVSDSSVVWHGDTVTARQLGDTTLDEEVEIPVGSVVSAGTQVFVRMRMEISATITEYSFDAGFHHAEQYDTTGGLGKTVRIRRAEQGKATPDVEQSRLHVGVRPNPAGERAELLLRVRDEGSVEVRLFTMLGEQAREFPSAEISREGDYTQLIDLRGLQPGIYLLVAQQGNHKATVKVTVAGE